MYDNWQEEKKERSTKTGQETVASNQISETREIKEGEDMSNFLGSYQPL